MSVSLARGTVGRLQKDIADLRVKEAQESKKEAELTAKMVRYSNDGRASKTPSIIASKMNEASRASAAIASVQLKRAELSKSVGAKSADLYRAQTNLEKAEDEERKRIATDQKKADDARARRMKLLDEQLAAQRRATLTMPVQVLQPGTPQTFTTTLTTYDVFISHASEDKESFVRPFATKLALAGVKSFYDEMTLDWGDSLRRRIEEGLARSRFGIVVLSKNFFAKEWPQRELDGLVQLEMQGHSRILPIWHEISKDEVTRFSPMLADKLALSTTLLTVDEIVKKLVEINEK